MPARDLDPVWKALADPTRRKILDLLRVRPRTTGELCEPFARLSRFAVMKHLAVLQHAGLVLVRRSGRERWNYLNAVPIRRIYERWVSGYESHWAAALTALQRVVEQPPGQTPGLAQVPGGEINPGLNRLNNVGGTQPPVRGAKHGTRETGRAIGGGGEIEKTRGGGPPGPDRPQGPAKKRRLRRDE